MGRVGTGLRHPLPMWGSPEHLEPPLCSSPRRGEATGRRLFTVDLCTFGIVNQINVLFITYEINVI